MEPFIGQISLISWPWVPYGWALCDGSLLPVQQNQALYSLIGTAYGGDGRNTFGLPDLRGRVPVGVNPSGNTLPALPWSKPAGASTANVPLLQHTHATTMTGSSSFSVTSAGNVAIPATTSSTGSSDMPSNTSILAPSADSSAGATVNVYSTGASTATLKPFQVSVSGNGTISNLGVGIANAGVANAAVNLYQPCLAMYYVIALIGNYPMRPY